MEPTLTDVIEKLERIQSILKESPEVLEALKLLKETNTTALVTPVKAETFIEASQAAEMLKVSPVKIGSYRRQGLLTAYRVPESTHNKYKLSDVMGLAREVRAYD